MLRRTLLHSALAAPLVAAATARCGMTVAASATDPVVIVGAGVTGLAAAEVLTRAGVPVVILEAAPRIGGRAQTVQLAGRPVDLGAHFLHGGSANPLIALARRLDLALQPAERAAPVLHGADGAVDRALTRATQRRLEVLARALDDAEGRNDASFAQAWPAASGDVADRLARWELSVLEYGAEPEDLSVLDWARLEVADSGDRVVAAGLGTLVRRWGRAAIGSATLRLSTAVTAIDWGGRPLRVMTSGAGTVEAAAVLVTVSVGVLAADTIRFTPALPDRHRQALKALSMGSYLNVVLSFDRDVLGDQAGYRMSATATEPAGVYVQGGGSGQVLVYTGGTTGWRWGRAPAPAVIAAALDQVASLAGTAVRRRLLGALRPDWNTDPRTLGSYAHAHPGGFGGRAALAAPLRHDRPLLLAGEATSPAAFTTLQGAYGEGRRAARVILAALAGSAVP